ncbi:alpha/beta hydrolase fold [Marivirga sericea]|uniref:Alpha/beta hydrolase fold n=1 Tax=Marivirga sericea TaxID=1028 RepID=A0A1X7JNB2_9BACT|nr:alpha/beta fold hydrolase [Marivirga sericea]SMG29387.1 alpha/beta hydrolase fold [Marivirga sericea]
MQKPNLILLHGALGSSQSFENLKPLLSKNFNLIIPDLKWHGSRSAADSKFRMQDLITDFENILQKENIHSANVFGFSMGGYVALSLALKHPEQFQKIMTLGTKLDWKPEQSEKESKMLNPEKIQEKVPQFADHLKSLHGKNWDHLCRQTAHMMKGLGVSPILTTENISTIDLPIKLCLGDQDHMVSLEETKAFYSVLLKGEMKLLSSCPHPIEKLDPKLLEQSVLDFFP